MSLMEKFSDPTLFETLTKGETAIGALITTLMGMGITFIVLLLLWALISLMTKLINKADKPKTPKAPVGKSEVKQALTAAAVEKIENSDSQLIAVITAAIAAFEGENGVSSNLIVRKISRVSGQKTAWNSAGCSECIESRRF